MQKLTDGERLNLPIEIYMFKRQYYWIIVMIALFCFIFGGLLLFTSLKPFEFVLAIVIGLASCIFCIFYIRKIYSSSKPVAVLYEDKLIMHSVAGKVTQTVTWGEIRELEGYSSQYGNGIMLYLNNRPPFEDTVDVKLYNGAVIEGSLLNTREIENIFRQFVAYHRKSNSDDFDDSFIIRYRNIKGKMSDWA